MVQVGLIKERSQCLYFLKWKIVERARGEASVSTRFVFVDARSTRANFLLGISCPFSLAMQSWFLIYLISIFRLILISAAEKNNVSNILIHHFVSKICVVLHFNKSTTTHHSITASTPTRHENSFPRVPFIKISDHGV